MKKKFLLKRHNRIRIVLVFLLLINFPGSGFSQGRSISGIVTDESGEPLPGVNIFIKGTTSGTVSDVNGNYIITVPDNDAELVFSYLGYLEEQIFHVQV